MQRSGQLSFKDKHFHHFQWSEPPRRVLTLISLALTSLLFPRPYISVIDTMPPRSSDQQTEAYELQTISQLPSLSPPGAYPSDAPQTVPDDRNAATSATDLAMNQTTTPCKSRLTQVWGGLTIAKLRNALPTAVALLGFPLTAIVIWPSFLAASDGHKAEQIAEWTARKDFIEACESVRTRTYRNIAPVRKLTQCAA